MMPDSQIDEIPSALPGAADVPQMLLVRLVEEVHLHEGLRQLSAAMAAQAATVRRLEHKGFPLAGLLRKVAKRQEGPELRAARVEEERLTKISRRLEDISRKLGAEVETLVDVHLADILPEYTTYRDARKRLEPWEQAVIQFQSKVGRLVDLLGQARNMASSGYDKKRKVLSGTAKTLLERAVDAAKGLTKLVETTNEAARGIGQMPEISFGFRAEELVQLENLDIGKMQADFDRIITLLEGIQKSEMEAVKSGGIGEAEIKRQQAGAYLADYVAQLRQHVAEHHLVADDVGAVVQRLEARFLNR